MDASLETRVDTVERQLIRLETILDPYEKRFASMEAAMNRLTWTVSLWGGVITILLGLFLTLGTRE